MAPIFCGAISDLRSISRRFQNGRTGKNVDLQQDRAFGDLHMYGPQQQHSHVHRSWSVPAMRPSSATVSYSAVKDQLVALSLEIEVRERAPGDLVGVWR